MSLTKTIGVAISTTGDEHRLGFLETAARNWWSALAPFGQHAVVYVTVDGTEAEAERVAQVCAGYAIVYRVGQPTVKFLPDQTPIELNLRHMDGLPHRMGVAVNKNTGLELLMNAGSETGYPTVEHLFLSDDDTSPRGMEGVILHTAGELAHSMVCWGKGRLGQIHDGYAEWTWPRGVVLYSRRHVVTKVGGMVEEFGPGGHEHAEWSRRIHTHGFTPAPFCSPTEYALDAQVGRAHGAYNYWHAEDMPRIGEHNSMLGRRRKAQTSVRRTGADWPNINQIMASQEGSTAFVPFRAHDNGRASATLYPTGA